jgi:mRNA interferase YafQ
MSRHIIFGSRFKKALKLAKKRGGDEEKLYAIMRLLAAGESLPLKCRPHKLVGNHAGKWECHIEPDRLLFYDITDDTLTLLDTGTHSDLFT